MDIDVKNRYISIVIEELFIRKLIQTNGILVICDLINDSKKNSDLEYSDYLMTFVNGGLIEPESNFINEISAYIIGICGHFYDFLDYKHVYNKIISILEKYVEITVIDKKIIEKATFEYKKMIDCINNNLYYQKIYSSYNYDNKISLSDISLRNIYKINDFSDIEIINLIYFSNIGIEILCMLDCRRFFSVMDKFMKGKYAVNYPKLGQIGKKFIEKILK